jgi:hypothetical protein
MLRNITDEFLGVILGVVSGLVDSLPKGQPLDLPGVGGFWGVVTGVDSLVPILGPVYMAAGLLAAMVVFVGVRMVLTVWNLIWP